MNVPRTLHICCHDKMFIRMQARLIEGVTLFLAIFIVLLEMSARAWAQYPFEAEYIAAAQGYLDRIAGYRANCQMDWLFPDDVLFPPPPNFLLDPENEASRATYVTAFHASLSWIEEAQRQGHAGYDPGYLTTAWRHLQFVTASTHSCDDALQLQDDTLHFGGLYNDGVFNWNILARRDRINRAGLGIFNIWRKNNGKPPVDKMPDYDIAKLDTTNKRPHCQSLNDFPRMLRPVKPGETLVPPGSDNSMAERLNQGLCDLEKSGPQ